MGSTRSQTFRGRPRFNTLSPSAMIEQAARACTATRGETALDLLEDALEKILAAKHCMAREGVDPRLVDEWSDACESMARTTYQIRIHSERLRGATALPAVKYFSETLQRLEKERSTLSTTLQQLEKRLRKAVKEDL